VPPSVEPIVYDEVILNAAGLQPGTRVLDIGCGQGDLTLALLARGAVVTGLDLSEGMVGLARKRVARYGHGREATFVVAPVESTGLPADTFDVAVGRWILHHVDLPSAAAELARVLTPGGRLVVLENSGANPILTFARDHLAGRFGIPRFGTKDERPLIAEDWQSLDRHFASVHPEYPIFDFFELFNRQVLGYRSRRMNDLFNRLDNALGSVPRLRRYSFRVLVVAVTSSAGSSSGSLGLPRGAGSASQLA